MIEYTDGHFGTIAPSRDIIDLLKSKFEQAQFDIKSVHFGEVSELQKLRDGKLELSTLRSELDDLKREMDALKPKGKVQVYSLEDIPK